MARKNKHELKTWPEYFQPIFLHEKDFEVRLNDRNFQIGDELILQEYEPESKSYTGRAIKVYISYILNGGKFGIEKGYVVLSIKSYRQ